MGSDIDDDFGAPTPKMPAKGKPAPKPVGGKARTAALDEDEEDLFKPKPPAAKPPPPKGRAAAAATGADDFEDPDPEDRAALFGKSGAGSLKVRFLPPFCHMRVRQQRPGPDGDFIGCRKRRRAALLPPLPRALTILRTPTQRTGRHCLERAALAASRCAPCHCQPHVSRPAADISSSAGAAAAEEGCCCCSRWQGRWG